MRIATQTYVRTVEIDGKNQKQMVQLVLSKSDGYTVHLHKYGRGEDLIEYRRSFTRVATLIDEISGELRNLGWEMMSEL
jgi:hypothetical protein